MRSRSETPRSRDTTDQREHVRRHGERRAAEQRQAGDRAGTEGRQQQHVDPHERSRPTSPQKTPSRVAPRQYRPARIAGAKLRDGGEGQQPIEARLAGAVVPRW